MCRGLDQDIADFLAIEFAKVALVTGQQMAAAELDCREQYRHILLDELHGIGQFAGERTGEHDYPGDKVVQYCKATRVMQLQVLAGFHQRKRRGDQLTARNFRNTCSREWGR